MKSYFLTGTYKAVSALMALIFLSPFQGCMFYYKVQTLNKVTPQEIMKFDSLGKYLVLHSSDSAYHLTYPAINDNTLSGDLSVLPDVRRKYITTKSHGVNRYKNTKEHDESCVLNEVHLYVNDSLVPKQHAGKTSQISCSAIQKTEIYQKDKRKTTASWLVPALVCIPLIGAGVLIIIIASSPAPEFNMGTLDVD